MTAQHRIAGAPISWGVCEVPNWGFQMPASRVLREMQELGLGATEFGPDGFLPSDPASRAATLADHGLLAVGGFTPLVLHSPTIDPLAEVERLLPIFVASEAEVMVVSADTGLHGYDSRPALEPAGWRRLLGNLDRISEAAERVDVRVVLHPHVGTMIESREDVSRVLEGSTTALCLDTGHLMIGGTDPVELTKAFPERIAHTHLKDVDGRFAARVRSRDLTYTDAVRGGMYRPLGQGDVDIAAIVRLLADDGYNGWYTLEQDTVLTDEPLGQGPVGDVATSANYVRAILDRPPFGQVETGLHPGRF